ncbi:MAG: FAD-dependent oxidoreductase, partial [Dehalococcoidia bacterium]|nr:FAD-dependent oxidoreductase [Dehalococcoidia bacterium]
MAKVVVVGGGFAGCAAAVSAAKSGAQTTLVERTDMLLAGGIRAGRMNFEGKLVLAEEAKALGAEDIFAALESIVLHRSNIIEEAHGYVYNTSLAEPTVRRTVEGAGVALRLEDRAVDVLREGDRVLAVKLESGDVLEGDSFVDCTGSTGGVSVCTAYGGGC